MFYLSTQFTYMYTKGFLPLLKIIIILWQSVATDNKQCKRKNWKVNKSDLNTGNSKIQ